MKWVVWTADDGKLWVLRPRYKDLARERKPGYENIKIVHVPDGVPSVVQDGVTYTFDDITIDGSSIYVQATEDYFQAILQRNIHISNDEVPLKDDTVTHLVEPTDVPGDHSCDKLRCKLRDAWEWTDRVSVNMPKARLIRDNKFKGIKVREILRAQALDDDAEVARLKAIVFDTSVYSDPGALEAAWPEGLPNV